MDILATVGAINGAIEIARAVRSADKEIAAADLKLQMADLIDQLANTKIALTELQEELRAKDGEIGELKANFAFRGELVEARNLFFRKHADGDPVGRPFCPRCNEVDGKWISMQRKAGSRRTSWCPECKAEIEVSGYADR